MYKMYKYCTFDSTDTRAETSICSMIVDRHDFMIDVRCTIYSLAPLLNEDVCMSATDNFCDLGIWGMHTPCDQQSTQIIVKTRMQRIKSLELYRSCYVLKCYTRVLCYRSSSSDQ